MPRGISVVQVVTVIVMLGLLVYLSLIAILSRGFSGYPSVAPLVWPLFVLMIFGFIIAGVTSNRAVIVWYAANMFWVVFLVLFIYLGFVYVLTGVYYIIPLFYCVGCVLYFQTREVRSYYGVFGRKRKSNDA